MAGITAINGINNRNLTNTEHGWVSNKVNIEPNEEGYVRGDSMINNSNYENVTSQTSIFKKSNEDDIEKIFKTFAKAISAELRYQSPDSPADTSQIVNTMAQMNNLIGQARSNQLMKEQNRLAAAEHVLTTQKLLGKKVLVPSNQINYEGGAEIVEFEIPENFENAKITISNQNKEIIFAQDFNSTAGEGHWTWNGDKIDGSKAPKGIYKVEIESLDTKKNVWTPIATSTMARVDSMEFDKNKNPIYYVGDQMIKLSDMKRISKNFSSLDKLISPIVSSQENTNEYLQGIYNMLAPRA